MTVALLFYYNNLGFNTYKRVHAAEMEFFRSVVDCTLTYGKRMVTDTKKGIEERISHEMENH